MTAIPVDGLTLTANYGYLDFEDDTNVRPLAPESNAYIAAQYDVPAFANGSQVSFRVDAAWKDDAFMACPVGSTFTPTGCTNLAAADLELDEATKMGARTDLGARISLGEIPIGGLPRAGSRCGVATCSTRTRSSSPATCRTAPSWAPSRCRGRTGSTFEWTSEPANAGMIGL